jgi:hypothetical protein
MNIAPLDDPVMATQHNNVELALQTEHDGSGESVDLDATITHTHSEQKISRIPTTQIC